MKKLIFLLLLAAAPMFAQAGRFDNNTWTVLTSAGKYYITPQAGSVVSVCSYPANGLPCTNLATLYTDNTGVVACNGFNGCQNPVTADSKGNFGFWVTPGTYQYTYNYGGVNYGPFSFTVGSSGVAVTLTGNQTVGGTKTFTSPIVASGGVQGDVTSTGTSTFNILNATALNGPLTGNVTGNITSAGTSTFSTATASHSFDGPIGFDSPNTGYFGVLAISTGIDGVNKFGLKHGRSSTGSIAAGTHAPVTVTWGGTGFLDANYTPVCSILDTSAGGVAMSIDRITAQTATTMTVQVFNGSAGSLTGTLNCIGIHDSGAY